MNTNLSNLNIIATEINREHAEVEQALQSAVHHATQCGQLLIQAKKEVQHGEWLTWLKTNCTVSERTAQAYMRLAKELPLLPDQKRNAVADLPLRQALKALAKPAYLPPAGKMATGLSGTGRYSRIIITEDQNASGYFGIALFNLADGVGDQGEGYVDYWQRGIVGHHVDEALASLEINVDAIEWTVKPRDDSRLPWTQAWEQAA